MSVKRGPRKSLVPTVVGADNINVLNDSIGKNDDAQERAERILSKNVETGQTPCAGSKVSYAKSRLAKMTVAERDDHIEKCVQLNAENKISTKNAFSLLLIDQLIEQVKRQGSNFQVNFQVASTQLDASAKIYACRVDKVHTEALRIAGGLLESDKKASKKRVEDAENSDGQGQSDDELETSTVKDKKKYKKKTKVVIVKNETLTSNSHLKNSMKSTDGYLQDLITSAEASEPGNAFFMSNLGITSLGELTMFSDIVPTGPRVAEDLCSSSTIDMKSPPWMKMFPCLADRQLCPQLKCLLSESQDSGDIQQDQDGDDGVDDFHAYDDGDAGINDHEDIFTGNGNINENDDDLEDATGTVVPAAACRNEPAVIVDFSSSISAQLFGPLQYSLHHKKAVNLMGGPGSWKIGCFVTSRPSEVNKKVVAKRKTKEPVVMEFKDNPVYTPYKSSMTNQLSIRTVKSIWIQKMDLMCPEEDINLPGFEKVWVRPQIVVQGLQGGAMEEMREKSDMLTAQDIDSSMGADNNDADMFLNDSNHELGEIQLTHEHEPEALISTSGTNDIVTYALRAKKIDMKLLKVTLWKMIKLVDSNKENTASNATSISLRDLYRDLPSKLPVKMAEVLTPHLAFMALLHLANEENLLLKDTPDLSDVLISCS